MTSAALQELCVCVCVCVNEQMNTVTAIRCCNFFSSVLHDVKQFTVYRQRQK
jgi:hypothetical protein